MSSAALSNVRALSDELCQMPEATGGLRRYFLHNWPSLCFLACDGEHCFGTIICKLDDHNGMLRGYIAMLVVEQAYRGCGAGLHCHCTTLAAVSLLQG